MLYAVKRGLYESELYKILDYTNFLPSPGEIPFNTMYLKSELYESEIYETWIRNFRMIWLNTEHLSWKIAQIRNTPLLSKIDLCSATSTESSRRDLSNDMGEHGPILKNNQITHYFPYFSR